MNDVSNSVVCSGRKSSSILSTCVYSRTILAARPRSSCSSTCTYASSWPSARCGSSSRSTSTGTGAAEEVRSLECSHLRDCAPHSFCPRLHFPPPPETYLTWSSASIASRHDAQPMIAQFPNKNPGYRVQIPPCPPDIGPDNCGVERIWINTKCGVAIFNW